MSVQFFTLLYSTHGLWISKLSTFFHTVLLADTLPSIRTFFSHVYMSFLLSVFFFPSHLLLAYYIRWGSPQGRGFVSLPLLSPHLRRFCGWMRVGGYPQDDSSIRWGSPQGRGFVCGLCSAGLPCCQVCTSCLCGRPTHPPSLYNLVDFSLVSPLLRPCSASHYTLVKSRHRHYGTVHKLSALRHSIYIIISTTPAHRYCGTVCKL
jgi:hypothetical protein